MRPALIALLLVVTLVRPAAAASSSDGQRLLGPGGAPLFLTGFNYEGPADRAWQMWDNGKFDANLIDADFQKAYGAAGGNVMRIFVQASLARREEKKTKAAQVRLATPAAVSAS